VSYNSRVNEQQLAEELCREGFSHTYVWEDGPNMFYAQHTHAMETTHIILRGEMTLTIEGKSQTFGVGERCDVAAGAMHSAKMGASGCRYLIGER
jgi:mannose-6-phosphate isomerase-like protein (cupin superfamily)